MRADSESPSKPVCPPSRPRFLRCVSTALLALLLGAVGSCAAPVPDLSPADSGPGSGPDGGGPPLPDAGSDAGSPDPTGCAPGCSPGHCCPVTCEGELACVENLPSCPLLGCSGELPLDDGAELTLVEGCQDITLYAQDPTLSVRLHVQLAGQPLQALVDAGEPEGLLSFPLPSEDVQLELIVGRFSSRYPCTEPDYPQAVEQLWLPAAGTLKVALRLGPELEVFSSLADFTFEELTLHLVDTDTTATLETFSFADVPVGWIEG